jgi:hypothetical protein
LKKPPPGPLQKLLLIKPSCYGVDKIFIVKKVDNRFIVNYNIKCKNILMEYGGINGGKYNNRTSG